MDPSARSPEALFAERQTMRTSVESILDPMAKVVAGYERGEVSMPSYSGVLSDGQIQSLILFIKSLGGDR